MLQSRPVRSLRLRMGALVPALVLVAALGLAACDSAEDRAARHYESALTLLAAGDADRALVELRNVFQLQGHHREARLLYADTQLERGEIADAWSNYLRLVEQYPDDLDGRRALAVLGADARDWTSARRHAEAGLALAPDDPALAAVLAAVDYRDAVADRNAAARADAVARARALVAQGGPVFAARVVVIDALVIAGDGDAALAALDAALDERPAQADLQALRLRLLAAAGDDDAVAAQLLWMVELFPEDAALREALVGWYLDRGRSDEAVAFLRARAQAEPDDAWPRLALARYLAATEGPQAAQAELDAAAARAVAADAPGLAIRLRAAAATLRLEGGDTDAIAGLEAALAALPEGDAALPEALDARLTLARMLDAQGRRDDARPLVDAVLQADAGHVGALRQQAAWAIADDRTDTAILLLRRALQQAPRDAGAMMQLAEAHLRDGSRELAAERFALAVEVSGRGVPESLRYAGFLAERGRIPAAEGVLNDALRAHPGELRLVVGLAELLIRAGEVDRAGRHIATLQQRAANRPDVAATLERLEALALLAQGQSDDLVSYLDGLVAAGSRDIAAVALSVQARLAEGRADEAAAWVDSLRDQADGLDPTLEFLRAGLHMTMGEGEAAEAIYRRILEVAPGAEGPVRALHGLLLDQGRADEAAALLAEARALRPEAQELAWLDASLREGAGDLAGAMAIYERLHAANPANDIFANNLASLMVRDPDALDAEVLARAQHIARRLRHAERPEFRATWGRILALRGDAEGALPHLRHAAAGLPGNAQVQLYLGEALAAADHTADARAAFDAAAAAAGDDAALAARIAVARDALGAAGN